ncbi:MAG: hypothetical protein FWF18_01050 [Dehalococcoidia bacterium]|nr:hypothetical protein [Dehalococcoidia bacterium]
MLIKMISLILCVLIFMTGCACNAEKMVGAEKMIINKSQGIVQWYEGSKQTSALLGKAELLWLEHTNNKGRDVFSNMDADDFVLNISFKAKNAKGRVSPLEIYAIFNCYIELQKQLSECNVVSILCSYSRGLGIDDASTWLIIITYDEFELLYNNTDIDDKKSNELAKELGDMWINENHYNRLGLVFEDSDKYRELLITPWKNNQPSLSVDFSAGYFYGSNKLSVYKISHYNDTISSSQTTWSTYINETGFLYGVWNEQNSIWLYGEDIGIRLYKFDGDKNWEQADYTDENQIPYALKKVLETKR